MIETKTLRSFLAVAETLHFGRAAALLHMTQPPLSRQIAALERALGVRLFERDSRHVRLTPAGIRFQEDARAVLLSLQQACLAAQQVHAGEQGSLEIGFMMHAAHSSMPPLAKSFMSANPLIHLGLREMLPMALIEGVRSGTIDAGIGFPPKPAGDLSTMVLLEEPLCVAAPIEHPLATRASLEIVDLEGEPLITAPADVVPTLRDAIDGCFGAAGLRPRIRMEVHLQQSIVSLVASGLGVALVPCSLSRMSMPDVAFIPLKNPPKVQQALFWSAANRNPVMPRFLASAMRNGKDML
ncbi:TPA: LysR family transcriptional regulator [Stenotrophomonas maltophilia]|nr:LysR family transcriptional regulator [Stenotrophomonas maltophilia]